MKLIAHGTGVAGVEVEVADGGIGVTGVVGWLVGVPVLVGSGSTGVVLMVGGNIPGVTRTISIDIYDRVQASDYAAANGVGRKLQEGAYERG